MFVEGCLCCRRMSVLSKDVCFVEGFLLGRRISVLPKDFCFADGCLLCRRMYVLVEGFLFCRKMLLSPAAWGLRPPIVFLNDQCFVLCCRRMSVLSKDVCVVEGFMFCLRMLVLSKDFCSVEGCDYHPPLGAFGPLFF